jgi:hypothetical protein
VTLRQRRYPGALRAAGVGLPARLRAGNWCFWAARERGPFCVRRRAPGVLCVPGAGSRRAGVAAVSPCGFDFAFDLDFDFWFWVGGGVEWLFLTSPSLLFEEVRSGTFATERSHPPTAGRELLSNSLNADSVQTSGRCARWGLCGRCPAAV